MQNTLVVFDKSGSAQTFTASPEQTLIDAINEAADLLEFFETNNIVGVGIYEHGTAVSILSGGNDRELHLCNPTGLMDPVFAVLGYESESDTTAVFCLCDTHTKTLHGTLKQFVRVGLAMRSDYVRCSHFRLRMVENTQPK